jgi:TP901 family phage tail tape measure protein
VATVANLFIRIAASSSEFEKTLKGVEAQFNKTGAKLQSVGANLTKAVTLPILAVGGAAAKAAVDFESSFAGIRKTVGATEPEFAALAKGIREMAKTKPIDVNELNKIGELGGQLGIAKEGMMGFISTVADLGVTTNMSTEQAAEGIARLSNIMQTPADQFSNLGSTLVDLGNKFAASEAEILEFGLRIAGAGQLANLSEANVLAIGTAFASVGIEAEAGGTAVQKVLLQMVEAVNTGGDDLAKFADAAGLTSQAFADLFKSNPAEAFTLFVEGLGKSGQKAQGILTGLELNDARLTRSFLSLGNAGDLLRRSIDAGSDAYVANNALTREAGERYKTAASQLTLLYNAAYDVGITLGQVLVPKLLELKPAIEGAIGAVATLVGWFAQLPSGVQTTVIAVAGLAAALGPVAYGLGAVIKAGAGLAGLLRMIPGAAAGWGLLANPITLTAGAIGAVLYALKQLTGSWTSAFKILMPPVGFFLEAWQKAGDAISKVRALMPGGAGTPTAPGAPKAAINSALGPAMEINQAMSLLDQQLDTNTRKFKTFGDEGAKAGKKIKKELLEATRALDTSAAIYTGLHLGGGVNTGAGNMGGMMSQLQTLFSYGNDPRMRPGDNQYRPSLQDAANQFGMSAGALPTVETLNVTQQAVEYAAEQTARTAKETVDGIRSSFQYFTGSLSGGMAALVGGLMNILEKGASKGGWMQKMFGGKMGAKIGAGIDIGMAGFGGGFAMGEEFGRGKGALAGAGMGAAAGFMAGGPIGAAIGGIAGLFGGLFGGGKKKREEQAKMADAKAQLLDQFGSMEELQKVAARAGVSVDLLFSTTKAKEFQGEMDRVTAAIEEMQKRVATTVGEIDKVMAKGGLIGKELWGSILRDGDAEEIKAKLEEVFAASVERSAEGFGKIAMNFELLKRPINEIGVLADAAFAGLLAGGASIPEAIAQMGDGLAHIQELLAGSGQAASGPLATLLNYQAITQANQGLFELLSGVDDMLTGLGNSGLLTQERFTALGATIAQAFGQLQTQGVAANTALELMQPQLQKLWEAQQMFGLQTDAATQALIDQAVQQGIVGQNMKDVNSQILDVLKAIATVLGAEIPGALAALPGQVQEAATAFTAIKIPDIKVGVRPNWKDWDWPEQPGGPTGGTGVKPMATGGIVTRPTHALIGEAGPEAVIPLDEWKQSSINVTVNGTADRDFARVLAKQISLGGDVKTAWRGALN